MRERISACITAGNEEKNIRRCIESVRWADEIVVVDSYSTDRTPEICREYTDLVYQHSWQGYIGQKNLIKDLATGPWILFIDADEEVSPELRQEIIAEFESGRSKDVAGYEFPRIVRHLGRWITHGDWYPDAKLRLFRKELGHCAGKEPHDRTTVDGPIKRLKGRLNHYSYDDLEDQIETMNRFSSITANVWAEDRRTFRMHDLLFRPVWRFLRCYLVKRGILDGLPGLIIASTAAFGVLAKYAKLWEIVALKRSGRDGKPGDGAADKA
jgi:glycosyltransferase involved in cell wall biosynthesis